MSRIISREIRLASRPRGLPTPQNFIMASVELPPPQGGEVLVRNLFMSVDPYMRGRMNEGKSYVPPFEIGRALDGAAVGQVVESNADGFRPGREQGRDGPGLDPVGHPVLPDQVGRL